MQKPPCFHDHPSSTLHQSANDPPAEVSFLLEAARALASTGIPADNAEAFLKGLARKLGLGLDCFTTHTGQLLQLHLPDGRMASHIVQSRAEVMNLGRLGLLSNLAMELLKDRCPREEALPRLRAIMGRAECRPAWQFCVAHAILSACVASLLGGGIAESLVAGVLGAFIGFGLALGRGCPSFDRILPCLGGLVTGAGSALLSHVIGGFSPVIATLAALIVLIPCQSMVMATNEFATDHHLAGAARAIHSALELGQLATGLLIAEYLGQRYLPGSLSALPARFPFWVPALSIFLAAPAFVVIFRGRWSDLPSILAACALAFMLSRWAGGWAGPAFAAGVTAFCLGISTNVWADLCESSPFIPLLPSMVILAPGVSGLQCLTQVAAGKLGMGVEHLIRMGQITMALLIGLLVSRLVLNMATPQRVPD